MPGPKKRQEPPMPVRLPPELRSRIKFCAEKLGVTEAEVIRVCVGIGLRKMAAINYDLEGAVIAAAEFAETPALKAAEDPAPYPAKPKKSNNG